MIESDIKYPILLIRNGDKNLYGMNKGLGLVSRGGDKFYEGSIQIIDKEGNVFKLKSILNINKAKLKDSIRHLQPMKLLSFDFEKAGQINLDELKSEIKEHIKQSPKHWLSLGTVETIEELINEKKTFSQLINLFR